MLTVDPGRHHVARLVGHHDLGLPAVLAEPVGGVDGEQLGLPFAAIRTVFLTAEHDKSYGRGELHEL